ncbi:Cytochrome b561 and DOMON domain-containing protein At3g25290 [Hondaea fermentalgiana]|uniref:Cytochrome b561 and DOMON domain-containing protein At3g25290 n=1 Tax=Hondaea fermentalgiana TaxID=2315210 RepID=A0A2R5GHC4_9STRA|nr:Cytochrome b561 and DOMON domain-containing protein At3g25290 [Hondaea fermentalgiana]|eukprot:GBG27274.1 Cytochrome b561 and DOMON domain-containing protein At3g25290 [Hondaea fermentalgiana]
MTGAEASILEKDLGDGASLQVQRIDEDRFHVRVELANPPANGDPWLGIGIGTASATTCKMKSSRFVVGHLCSDASCGQDNNVARVQTYRATSYEDVVLISEGFSLEESSVSLENGVLVVEFESAGIASRAFKEAKCVAWASGLLSDDAGNTEYMHKHKYTGDSVIVDFASIQYDEDNALASTPAPSSVSTPQDTPAPTTTVTTALAEIEDGGVITGLEGKMEISFQVVQGSGRRLQSNVTEGSDDAYVQLRMTYPMSNGWMGIAISASGAMVQSHAVIAGTSSALPALIGEYLIDEYAAPQLYDGETSIFNASVSVVDELLQVSFSARAIAGQELDLENGNRIIFAVYEGSGFSASHGANLGDTHNLVKWASGGTVTTEDTANTFSAARLAHGVLMVLCFAFLFPMGAVPSTMRHRFVNRPSRWFDLHRGVQGAGVVGVLIAFFVILFSGSGSSTAARSHRLFGLFLIFLVLVQPMAAIMLRKTQMRSTWRVSHYICALIIFLGGLQNCFEGLVVAELVGVPSDRLVGLRVLLIMGTLFATGCSCLVFGSQLLRGFAAYETRHRNARSSLKSGDSDASGDSVSLPECA